MKTRISLFLIAFVALFLTASSLLAQDLESGSPKRERRRKMRQQQSPNQVVQEEKVYRLRENPNAADGADARDAVEVVLPFRNDSPYEIRYRHFGKSGRNAFRLGLGIDLDGETTEIYDEAQEETGTVSRGMFHLMLAPGWERHFNVRTGWQNVQVSPFFGVIAQIGMRAYSTKFEDTDGQRYILDYEVEVENAWVSTGNSAAIEARSSMDLGARFIFGADVYIYRSAYLGFECGVGPTISGRPEVIRKADGQDDITLSGMSGGFRLNTSVTGGVRFGVRF